jgi:hypothetical protein
MEGRKEETTLKRRISGTTRFKGEPLTLMRPFPVLQKATAVAVWQQLETMN